MPSLMEKVTFTSNYAAKTLFATQTLIAMLAIATIAFVVDSSTVWILMVAFVAAAKDIHRALYAFTTGPGISIDTTSSRTR